MTYDFFVGQRVVYTGKAVHHTPAYIGQTAVVRIVPTVSSRLLYVEWDNPEKIPNRTWAPLAQNMEPLVIDIGDLEDDL